MWMVVLVLPVRVLAGFLWLEWSTSEGAVTRVLVNPGPPPPM